MQVSILILFCSLFLSFQSTAQNLDEINLKRFYHTRNGGIALSSWAGANIITGTIGYFNSSSSEWQHFHEMNIYFNLVNLGLGIPSLFAKKEKQLGLTFEQTVKRQYQTEVIYLLNGALDLTYITTGFLMRSVANNPSQYAHRNRWRGFGNSMIMQGSFLLLFDFIKYGIHKFNGKRLHQQWQKITISPSGSWGLGLVLHYSIGSASHSMPYKFINKYPM